MTRYVVLYEERPVDEENGDTGALRVVEPSIEASNAQAACRSVAEDMNDGVLAKGVTLIAVPTRNWKSGRNTFRAETQRKLLRS